MMMIKYLNNILSFSGVEHFFIYNTAIETKDKIAMETLLSPYIKLGIIIIIKK